MTSRRPKPIRRGRAQRRGGRGSAGVVSMSISKHSTPRAVSRHHVPVLALLTRQNAPPACAETSLVARAAVDRRAPRRGERSSGRPADGPRCARRGVSARLRGGKATDDARRGHIAFAERTNAAAGVVRDRPRPPRCGVVWCSANCPSRQYPGTSLSAAGVGHSRSIDSERVSRQFKP